MLSDDIASRVEELSKRWHDTYHKFGTLWITCTELTCSADRELYQKYLSAFDTTFWCGLGRHEKSSPEHMMNCGLSFDDSGVLLEDHGYPLISIKKER